ncbi:PepSY-associated TM helix domain-containing protein [Sphingomonas fennica]|uniref:Peptidase n=1 Tax=Edaphosphingomonas fennica TaxID=114404 RepID=A0A2T4I5C2_9SPHN|nr:PepSY-associated TM helix domain-containing protein [Sphingomonas fennica]PTD25130.1 peptidase [Sphingomonas fennica]
MKTGFRQSMAWLHGWAGLVLGWLLFAMALTGTATVFRSEIGDWMRPEVTAAPDQVKATAAAIRYLEKAAPNAPAWYLTAPDDRQSTIEASYADGDDYRFAALDPNSGRPDGIRETLGGEFFYRFHFELQLPYPWGRILASAAGMLMLVALISGIITHRRIFADFFTLRTGKGKRSWLDAHNVLGVLAMPFHLMITFTGVLTLVTLTMPWGLVANYGKDTTTMFAEVAPGYFERERSGRPAPLGDVEAILADARRRFDGGRIGNVAVENPGDAAAVIQVLRDDADQLGYSAGKLAYDGVTGRLLAAYAEDRPAKKTFDVLYGLHMGRFAPWVSRWLYFLCGLALSATIASGLVLWTVSRPEGRGFGHHLVARLTVGTVAGLPIAMAAFFWANRLAPVGLADRPGIEVRAFFLCWAAAMLFGLARAPRRGWAELTAMMGLGWLLLPLVSALTTARGLPASLIHGDWLFAGFDLVALAIGCGALMTALHLHRRQPAAPRRRRPALA